MTGPATAFRFTTDYLTSRMEILLSWISHLIIVFLIPIIAMVWKPFSILIRHRTSVPRALFKYAAQGISFLPRLFGTLWTWGRFMIWRCILSIVPHWIILAYFWLVAPLHTEHWKTVCHKHVPSCTFDHFSIHKDTMVLTDVIHPTQGSFRMAFRGVINPTALDRTRTFAIWYLEKIAPSPAMSMHKPAVVGTSSAQHGACSNTA